MAFELKLLPKCTAVYIYIWKEISKKSLNPCRGLETKPQQAVRQIETVNFVSA